MADHKSCSKCGESNEAGRSYCWICCQKFDLPEDASGSYRSPYPKEKSFSDYLWILLKILGVVFLVIVVCTLLYVLVIFISCIGHW